MAGYVGNIPVPQSVREDQSFTATAGQTTFNTLGYTDGNRIKVTLNGVLLEGGGVDYTATNGSDVVLTVAAAVDDIVRFETFNEVQLVSNTSTTPIIKTNLTLKNDTHEDTDGGRESTVIFSGEQSGGEITTLAEIEASHDGTADDQKGDLIFRTNDGNDGTSPTERLRINSGGDMLFSSEDPSLTLANTTHEDTDGGRESTIVFQGEQSGGEVSTLAQIEAAHDGTGDDEKGDLIFRTNDGSDGTSPTEVLRLDSAGRVGVGTTPAAIADSTGVRSVQLGATFLSHFTPTQDGTTSISNNVYWDGSNNKALFTGPSTSYLQQDRSHRFRTAPSVSAGANVTATEVVRIDHEGIKFNGDTAAANALDDYEEGTFTGTLIGYYGNPSSAVTATGLYTKVGNKVELMLNMDNVNTSGASGDMWISGLPFTSAGVYCILPAQMNSAGTFPNSSPFGLVSGTICYFYKHASNAGVSAVAHNAGTGRTIRVSGNYKVA